MFELGYDTRLCPLTKHTAKPLLKVGGQTILDHVIVKVEKVDVISFITSVVIEFFKLYFTRLVNFIIQV